MTKQELDNYTQQIQENEERKAKAMLWALQQIENDSLSELGRDDDSPRRDFERDLYKEYYQ